MLVIISTSPMSREGYFGGGRGDRVVSVRDLRLDPDSHVIQNPASGLVIYVGTCQAGLAPPAKMLAKSKEGGLVIKHSGRNYRGPRPTDTSFGCIQHFRALRRFRLLLEQQKRGLNRM